jgi:hypothetical protein
MTSLIALSHDSDPHLDERFQFTTIPSRIGRSIVYDPCRICENPVPDLLPESHGGLGVDELDMHPVVIEIQDLVYPSGEKIHFLSPFGGILIRAGLSILTFQAQIVEDHTAAPTTNLQIGKHGRDHLDENGIHFAWLLEKYRKCLCLMESK